MRKKLLQSVKVVLNRLKQGNFAGDYIFQLLKVAVPGEVPFVVTAIHDDLGLHFKHFALLSDGLNVPKV